MDLSLYHKNGSACNDYHGPRRDDGLCVGQDNRNNDNKYPGAILQVSFHSTKEAMNCQPYNEVSQSRPHPKWWEHNLYFELKHYIYYFLFLRIIYDQRCPERLLIHKTLIEPPVLSHIKALIGSITIIVFSIKSCASKYSSKRPTSSSIDLIHRR